MCAGAVPFLLTCGTVPVPSPILFRMVFNVIPEWVPGKFEIGYSFSSKVGAWTPHPVAHALPTLSPRSPATLSPATLSCHRQLLQE